MAEQKEETPREKFARLANARAGDAISKINQIGKLANTSSYKYTAADVEVLEKALTDAVKATATRLRSALEGKAVADTTGLIK